MLPFFFQEQLPQDAVPYTLDETTSKHCIQVLRMKAGDALLLTDGKGTRIEATITLAERKHCQVQCHTVTKVPARPMAFALAIAFTKNNSRNEWLLEKATEMGIEAIYPIVTERSEKDKLKMDRLQSILTAAMLQSQQCYLPRLADAICLKDLYKQELGIYPQKFIAHCIDEQERKSFLHSLQPQQGALVLIGPEGDFSPAEIELSMSHGFAPVTFGQNRLRTETAGLYACTVFNAVHYG
ncbi:hypothetical protein DBR32_04630 [Taibaiella sp. KBW10]|uniref:RsmE family RNA methyltransferase n=1 Tax=Taibaiella sp. KBW10 TaxID=2153357 RepID=UPI000F5A8E85|nr:RsmE family RNA methyltransferase [Taibaiella sp. KBW10]RQO31259.1 hypothetical protein DBR32_04630 [Taibaiella sp. KBW10]